MVEEGQFVKVASLDELREKGRIVVSAGRHGIAVFHTGDGVFAVDNRCPHMGFPLVKGTVAGDILTCDWHHARFDLSSGGTFDLWADNVATYPVQVRGSEVWLNPKPPPLPRTEVSRRLFGRLRDGMEHRIALVIAKAVTSMLHEGIEPRDIVEAGGLYGCAGRQEGWTTGHTILTATANLLPYLEGDEKIVALTHGLDRISDSAENQPPWVSSAPLPGETRASQDELKRWFRMFVEQREPRAAERCLLTAIDRGAKPDEVADMIVAAATDHFYLDTGHVLDFTNKAFELLDHIGWRHASEVLPTLLPGMCAAQRAEEEASWRNPIDLVGPLTKAFEELPDQLKRGTTRGWNGFDEVRDLFLREDPLEIIRGLTSAIGQGAPPERLTLALALAAGYRVARFHVQNDFADWDTVHNMYTYCNALHQMMKRAPSTALVKGIYHGAMDLYLTRFLNVPKARLPHERPAAVAAKGEENLLQSLLGAMDAKAIDAAADAAYAYVEGGHEPRRLLQALALAMLQEDAGFHMYQTVDASVKLFGELKDRDDGYVVLAASARFLAAHAATPRSLRQTIDNAIRLSRGEALYEEA